MPTTYFGFDQLSGGDAAGYQSINALLTDIDSILNTRFGGIINTTNYSALGAGDAGKIIEWTGTAFATSLIDNANISSSAAIAYSKLALTGSIVNADINASAAIDKTKISGTAITAADTGTVTSTMIADGTIVNADINAAAGIAKTKISGTAITAADTGTVTATILASSLDLSSKTVTLPNGIMIDGAVVTPSTDDSAKVATTAFVQDAVQNYASGVGVINYAALASDAKSFDVPTSGTGVYFTSSGDFTSASLSTAQAQNPVVISAASSAIDLSLPNNIGTEGATITVCQTGTGAVTIKPKVGATATINGSTSNTYLVSAQYSVVTLLCLSNSGSNGTWIITGDYI